MPMMYTATMFKQIFPEFPVTAQEVLVEVFPSGRGRILARWEGDSPSQREWVFDSTALTRRLLELPSTPHQLYKVTIIFRPHDVVKIYWCCYLEDAVMELIMDPKLLPSPEEI